MKAGMQVEPSAVERGKMPCDQCVKAITIGVTANYGWRKTDGISNEARSRPRVKMAPSSLSIRVTYLKPGSRKTLCFSDEDNASLRLCA